MEIIDTEVVGTSPLIALLLLFCHLAFAATSDIDNGILGTPKVICGRDFVHFKVTTKKPFGGRVYVKGEFGNAKCVESVGTTTTTDDGTGEDEIGPSGRVEGNGAAGRTEFDESKQKRPKSQSKKEEPKRKNEDFGQRNWKQSMWQAVGAVPPEGEEEEEKHGEEEGEKHREEEKHGEKWEEEKHGEEEEEKHGEGEGENGTATEAAATNGHIGGRPTTAATAEEEADEETLRHFLLELQKRHNNNTNGSQRTIPSHLPGFGSADQLKRWRSFLRGKPGLDGQGFRRYGSRLSPDANGECPLVVCPPCEELKDKERRSGKAEGKRQRRLAPAKEHSAELRVPLGECNTRRDRMANPPGMQVSFTIVVSFHASFITRVDRAYNIQCAYQEPERFLSAQIDVSSPPIIQISNEMDTPQCEYRIHGQSNADQQVRNVRVGDVVEHEWICKGNEANNAQSDTTSGERMAQLFGLLVHDCFVDDGKNRREKVVDSKGCSRHPLVLPTPLYSPNSLRASVMSPVAKFPDGDLVGFQCSISVCMRDLGKCGEFTPPNCSENVPFGSNYDDIHSTQNRTKRSSNVEDGKAKTTMDWELNSPLMTVFDLAEGPEEATGGALYANSNDAVRQPPLKLANPSRRLLPTVHSVSQLCVSLPLFALLISASTFLVTVSTGALFVAMLFRDSFPNRAKH